ncbi:MAG: pyrroline-5-carboxylate reductase [Planctomycetia bacterium]|nr:pyrroline-5-carboxylate reductase [Planctomycetia bacterium]
MLQQTIGFVGAGQMARALASGFVKAGLIEGHKIVAADPVPAALEAMRHAVPGARGLNDNASVAKAADVLFLATKPQQIATALAALRSVAGPDKLVISIAAGVTLSTLSASLGEARLVRVMPNTPCLIGQSASGYCLGPRTTEADGQLVARLLSAVGHAFAVDEKLLDAVTGLSGSGPAFVYVMIEALSDGGVRMGLPRDVATALAAQTVRGAAEMVLQTGEHPSVLKDRVASPGGTTIAGLQALETGGLRGTLMAAVEAATRRSIELGQV